MVSKCYLTPASKLPANIPKEPNSAARTLPFNPLLINGIARIIRAILDAHGDDVIEKLGLRHSFLDTYNWGFLVVSETWCSCMAAMMRVRIGGGEEFVFEVEVFFCEGYGEG